MEEECTVETRHFELSGVTQKEVRDNGGSGWQEVMFQTNKHSNKQADSPLMWAACVGSRCIDCHIYISTRNRASTFLFTSKGLMLEGFTTFMDCCLSNCCLRWIISEASNEWQQRRMYFVELHSSQWLSCKILYTPAYNI